MSSRYEQRKKRRMADSDFRAGYEEADAEFLLLNALDHARESRGVTQSDLAEALGVTQSAVSQFLSGAHGATVDRLVVYLRALHLQARVEIVEAKEGEPALIVREVA